MSNLSWQEAAALTRKIKAGNNDSVGGSLAAAFIAVALVLVMAVPLIVYFVWSNALAIKYLWAWFMVPTFDLHPLTWAQAWGLSIVVTYLTHVSHTCKSSDERSTTEKVTEFVALFIKPWVAIGVGYICAHWYMHIV